MQTSMFLIISLILLKGEVNLNLAISQILMSDETQTLCTDPAMVICVNLASNKGLKICPNKASPGLVDGDQQQVAETIEDFTCPEKLIEIDFGGIFYFHAVIVYGGQRLVNGRLETENFSNVLCQ